LNLFKNREFAFDYFGLKEFIKLACNNHDDLVRCAKIALSYALSEEGSDHSESDFIKQTLKNSGVNA